MNQRRAARELAMWIALIAALLGFYAGAYHLMVKPVPLRYSSHGEIDEILAAYPVSPADAESFDLWGEPQSHGFKTRWRRFFVPVHWLDRRIRPRVWNP